MKFILFFVFTFYSLFLSAQITNIPDQNFEQALIDLGIDSDQTINGQVLTSDVASVTSLDLSYDTGEYYIPMDNITGIEDFTSLKFLNVVQVNLNYYNTPLNLSSLTDLEELYVTGDGDVNVNYVEKVILNNNPNLKEIYGSGSYFKTLVLKGSDVNLSNLYLNLGYYDFDSGGTAYVCVEVSNPNQAENGQGIYSTWNVSNYTNFSSDCNLSTSNFSEIDFEIFPNPTTDQFQVNSQEEIKEIKIYSLNGREVLSYSTQEKYDVSQLQPGVYFVKVFTGNTSLIQKLIKT